MFCFVLFSDIDATRIHPSIVSEAAAVTYIQYCMCGCCFKAAEAPLTAPYLGWDEQSTQQAGAQAGGADLLLLDLGVMGVLQQLDLVEHQLRQALRRAKQTQTWVCWLLFLVKVKGQS